MIDSPRPRRLCTIVGGVLLTAACARAEAFPLSATQTWTAEGNKASASFGASLSSAGDVNADGYSDLLVGAPLYDSLLTGEGAVFLYLGSPAGLSAAPAWVAVGGQVNAHFGAAVAFAGDVNGDGYGDVVIGAPDFDNDQADEGRGYLYLGKPIGLDNVPAWIREPNVAAAHFATSVACAGDVNGDGLSDVVIGVPGFFNGQATEGSASLFVGTTTALTDTPVWTVESNQAGAMMGTSVAGAGDVNGDGFDDILVGAPFADFGFTDQGRASLYFGHAGSPPSQNADWTAEVTQAGAHFGTAVAGLGDVNGDGYCDILVGAPAFDNGQNDEGRAFLFAGSATGPLLTPTWGTEGNAAGTNWASAISPAGDVNGDGYADVLVGASLASGGPLVNAGRASLYLGAATGLSTIPSLTVLGSQTGGGIGSAVACAGDVNGDGYSDIVIGASGQDNGETDEGVVFAYTGGSDPPQIAPSWTQEGEQIGAGYGGRVAGVGDVNGDGFGDVVVGANHYSNGQTGEGRAFLYLGSRNGLGTAVAWSTEANQDSAAWGGSLSAALDVNGDGYPDFLVGCPQWNDSFADEGRVSLYQGSATGVSSTASWTVLGGQEGAQLGESVASAGDVNGDGYADVIVGASLSDADGHPDAGRADVYLGSSTGLATTPAWTRFGTQDGAGFGFRVAGAGDVNADGFSDVLVSAWLMDDALADQGAAFLYLGSAAGLDTTPAWTAFGETAGSFFGVSLSTAGDADGDGRSDVIVGANRYDGPGAGAGRASVFLGTPSGLSDTPVWTATGTAGDMLGTFVTALDANRDGYGDVAVGAPLFSNGQSEEGTVRLFFGSPSGPHTTADWTFEGNRPTAHVGQSIASAGDVNGDAIPDLVVGTGDYTDPLQSEGAAFVFLGNGGDGIDHQLKQLRVSSSKPIGTIGLSDQPNAYRVSAIGRSSIGRTHIAMEYEAADNGVPLDGSHSIVGPFVDTGAPVGGVGSAATLDAVVTGLAPNTLSHWRVRFVTESPLLPRTPWLWLPANGLTEADVRTPLTSDARIPPTPDPLHDNVAVRMDVRPAVTSGPVTIELRGLRAAGEVSLAIYDVRGSLVRRLFAERGESDAPHSARWDGQDASGRPAPSGVYMVRASAGGTSLSRRIVIRR